YNHTSQPRCPPFHTHSHSFMSPITSCLLHFFFFNDPATTEIYTLSLHDALPIWLLVSLAGALGHDMYGRWLRPEASHRPYTSWPDRKSTRLNSSHVAISYAVFCLKKKKKKKKNIERQDT